MQPVLFDILFCNLHKKEQHLNAPSMHQMLLYFLRKLL